jgi:prevent-host-death family protein
MKLMSFNVKEAKNSLSKIINLAENGHPQVIRRHDREVAVVVSIEDWRKVSKEEGKTLLEILQSCPVDLNELDISRSNDLPREISFGD